MNGDDYGRLIYLGLLLVAVGSWVFVQNRQGIGKTLQQLAIWAFIFLGVIAGYGLWDDIRTTVSPQQSVLQDEGRVERRQHLLEFALVIHVESCTAHCQDARCLACYRCEAPLTER